MFDEAKHPADRAVARPHPCATRCLRHGPQHVRSGPRRVGRRDWRGWWGDEPPYHAPVFVLTHHARDPIEMEGGTTFHFVRRVRRGLRTSQSRRPATRPSPSPGGASAVRQGLRGGRGRRAPLVARRRCLGGGERPSTVAGLWAEPVEVHASPTRRTSSTGSSGTERPVTARTPGSRDRAGRGSAQVGAAVEVHTSPVSHAAREQNTTASATSSGVPDRPRGVFAR